MRNEKRKYIILKRIGQVIRSYIVFYIYEIDLNTCTGLQDSNKRESIFSTEFIKLLEWKKLTNCLLIMVKQLLQNGLGEHFYNSGRQLQPVLY